MSEKRVRSPNYPAISLPAAIERISTLYKNQHRHAAPREVVAKSLGFGALSGPAATVISALFKYGLLERVGTEAKISERALQILFPDPAAERESAIRAAASEPQLFAELNERFPGPVNDTLLRNYLTRRNFSSGALDAAILAFEETAEFVLQETGGHDSPAPTEERAMARTTETAAAASIALHSPLEREHSRQEPIPKTNRIRAGLNDGVYEVNALLVDTAGFDHLIKALEANRILFEKHTEVFDSETETWSKPTDPATN